MLAIGTTLTPALLRPPFAVAALPNCCSCCCCYRCWPCYSCYLCHCRWRHSFGAWRDWRGAQWAMVLWYMYSWQDHPKQKELSCQQLQGRAPPTAILPTPHANHGDSSQQRSSQFEPLVEAVASQPLMAQWLRMKLLQSLIHHHLLNARLVPLLLRCKVCCQKDLCRSQSFQNLHIQMHAPLANALADDHHFCHSRQRHLRLQRHLYQQKC